MRRSNQHFTNLTLALKLGAGQHDNTIEFVAFSVLMEISPGGYFSRARQD